MLFGTTAEFLKVFKIEKLEDLPPWASFQPPPETSENSDFELTEAVDVEEFVGDESQEKPEVSEGLEDIPANDIDGLAQLVLSSEDVEQDVEKEEIEQEEVDLRAISI